MSRRGALAALVGTLSGVPLVLTAQAQPPADAQLIADGVLTLDSNF